ncbi:biopolymer transporter ExbD [Pelagicoccus sp. SDUM812005]|uniref:ExbD/TolR family protein n=1 Tax=Pelagicoccus sp. SDUM812005 TaxID=3041257 RepID=UPI00280D2C91|nr:biopolymer transporter ExbD [Pelagicoccus sp. SDUM812005]MDQ8183480.1 biopolymer transporter ExbD [Pelagicoccus sp. SDUM812005]
MIRKKIVEQSAADEQAEINLSPLIDCVFILLIFYIVTTVFIDETGVDVNKPEAASSSPLDKQSMLIAITEDNRVFYAGKEIGVSGVGPMVKRQLARESIPVIIQADKKADHGVFSAVYGEAEAAGAEKVNFSTLD